MFQGHTSRMYVYTVKGLGGLKPPSVGGWKPPKVEVIYSGVLWMTLVIYIFTFIDMSFVSVSKDRGVHPSSCRPGVRDATIFYLRRLGCRLYPMSRMLCKWSRLLCSKAFMQWYAKTTGVLTRLCLLVWVYVGACICVRVSCLCLWSCSMHWHAEHWEHSRACVGIYLC